MAFCSFFLLTPPLIGKNIQFHVVPRVTHPEQRASDLTEPWTLLSLKRWFIWTFSTWAGGNKILVASSLWQSSHIPYSLTRIFLILFDMPRHFVVNQRERVKTCTALYSNRGDCETDAFTQKLSRRQIHMQTERKKSYWLFLPLL